MAVTEIQSGNATGSGSTASVTLGGTPAANNLLVAYVGINTASSDATITMSGWTALQNRSSASKFRMTSFYKTAGAGESATVSASISTSHAWFMVVVEVHSTSSGGWALDKQTNNSGFSTSPTTGTTVATTQAEEWWAACFVDNPANALSAPTNGFAIKDHAATGANTLYVTSKIVAATGTAATGGTYGVSSTWAATIDTFKALVQTVTAGGAALSGTGSLVGHPPSTTTAGGAALSGTGTLLGIPSYATPTFKIMAAFGSGATSTPVFWRDISSYVRNFMWTYGKQNELNQLQAGTATVILNDPLSHFDPSNTASPFYPNVKPGLPVWGRLFVGSNTYPLFYGFAERLPRTQRVTSVYTQRQIDLTDGFALLAYAGLATYAYNQESSSQRVTNVANDIDWPTANRRIGVGTSTLQAVAFANDDATTAQAHFQAVDDSEAGLLFVDGSNNLVFVGSGELAAPPYTVSQATFGDVASGGVYPYTSLTPSYDLDNTFNRWTVTRDGGSPQTAEDAASQLQYFLRAKQVATLLSSDAQALTLATAKLAKFKQPLNRIESMTGMPLQDITNTAQIVAWFGRGLGDRITIKETPPGFAGVQTNDYTIQRISGGVDVGPTVSATLTFDVWPV